MYVVVVEFVVVPEHGAAFLASVIENARTSTRDEVGCHQFDVAVASGEPGRILLYELYDHRPAFEAHLVSPHFLTFDAAVRPWIVEKKVRTFERIEPSAQLAEQLPPGHSRA